MSGGSFDYVCFAATSEIFGKLEQLRGMESFLRAYSKHEAADEILLYVKELETHARRIEVQHKRLHDLLYAIEWTASGDTNMEAVDKAYWKLMGMEKSDASITPP